MSILLNVDILPFDDDLDTFITPEALQRILAYPFKPAKGEENQRLISIGESRYVLTIVTEPGDAQIKQISFHAFESKLTGWPFLECFVTEEFPVSVELALFLTD